MTDADRGDATVEAVIIVPVIVVLTLLVVQFVLVWHGRHVAQAAAQTAARSAAAYRAAPVAGQAAGDAYLAEVAPNLLPGRTVTVTRTGPEPPPSSSRCADGSPFRRLLGPGAGHRSAGDLRGDTMTRPDRRTRLTRDRDRGSMTTEFVILAPIVIAILLLVVGLGRYAHGKQLVEQAAAAAARSASLTGTAGQAESRARRAAADPSPTPGCPAAQ